jgi:hypothetical protein
MFSIPTLYAFQWSVNPDSCNVPDAIAGGDSGGNKELRCVECYSSVFSILKLCTLQITAYTDSCNGADGIFAERGQPSYSVATLSVSMVRFNTVKQVPRFHVTAVAVYGILCLTRNVVDGCAIPWFFWGI